MEAMEYIAAMTLEEKCSLLSGSTQFDTKALPRLGVPSICFSDGPSGVRRQTGSGDHLGLGPSEPATCFPSASTMANAWDIELEEELGRRLGEEARSLGVDVLLGPGLNIKRSPLCGRNFEYFSEDPYLSGKLAAACIRGIQAQGVAACPKHFAVNSQETLRMHSDSVVDQRTLRELYLTAFEIAVKEGHPRWIMSSYNRINGVYANENRWLLRDLLREEWGFDGCVVTDWGGSSDHAAGVAAGSHMEMPTAGPATDRDLVRAVREGRVSEDWIDRMVEEYLRNLPDGKSPAAAFDPEEHHRFARRAAAEAVVLLKNEESLLPLAPGTRAAVIGDFAQTPRYQGAGSSMVKPTRLDNALEELRNSGLEIVGYAPGFRRHGGEDAALLARAVELAEGADVVLLFLGLDELAESEGLDRTGLRLPESQIRLLEEVSRVNPRVVLVLAGGAPMECPWLEHCKAMVNGYLGGQAGGGALADVLTGKVYPSGKLAETWPLRLEDTPAFRWFPGRERTAEYREGIYVGYRYYDTAGTEVRFPFGFGLSYTDFAYSDLTASEGEVSFTLTNTGARAGAEIAQVYFSLPDRQVFRPRRELKGFARITLEPGESRRVAIPLDDKAFRYFNVSTGRWEVEGGTYLIQVGASSRDIRLTAQVKVAGPGAGTPYDPAALPSYFSGQITRVGDEEFAALLGRPLPESRWDRTVPLDLNDTFTQLQYAKGWVGRRVYKALKGQVDRAEAKGSPDLDALFRLNMPFRGVAKMTGGMADMAMVQALVDIFNGRFWSGLGRLARSWLRKRSMDRRTISEGKGE